MIRDRSLLALLAGEFVSRLGSQFTTLALPWFVLVTTGSPSKMGLVFAVELAPIALLGIPSAVLVERFGPKRWLVSMDALRAPIVAAVPFLHAVGGLSFGLILVVGALHGAFSIGYFTSQRLILPAVVGEDEQRLAQANGVLEGTTNLTNLAGPALAGVLIAVLGAVNVMWIDAASYLASVVLIGLFVRVASSPGSIISVATGSLRACRSRASCSASSSRCCLRRFPSSRTSSTTTTHASRGFCSR
jgi:MFS family permease